VDADHCYRVGEQGILVHNVSLFNTNQKDLLAAEEFFAKLKADKSAESMIDCYCAGKITKFTPRVVPAPNSGWTVPDGVKWDMPTDRSGEWLGNRGDSDFRIHASRLADYGLTSGDNIVPYRKGQPYFDKWVVEWYEIKGLTGDNDDFKLIRLAVALRHNCKNKSGDFTPAAGLAYMNAQNPVLTPHHAYECYVQLVPRKLNALSHRGTAAALRAGEIKC